MTTPNPFISQSEYQKFRRQERIARLVAIATAIFFAIIIGMLIFAIRNTWKAEYTTVQICPGYGEGGSVCR